jgi:hypothetical protein
VGNNGDASTAVPSLNMLPTVAGSTTNATNSRCSSAGESNAANARRPSANGSTPTLGTTIRDLIIQSVNPNDNFRQRPGHFLIELSAVIHSRPPTSGGGPTSTEIRIQRTDEELRRLARDLDLLLPGQLPLQPDRPLGHNPTMYELMVSLHPTQQEMTAVVNGINQQPYYLNSERLLQFLDSTVPTITPVSTGKPSMLLAASTGSAGKSARCFN